MFMLNFIACEIETIITMLNNINEEYIYTHHKQSHKMYSGSAQRPTSTLKSSLPSCIILIRLKLLIIKDKINKILVYLSMQATPGVSGGWGLKSTLSVAPAEEIWMHTTGVSGDSVKSPSVSAGEI